MSPTQAVVRAREVLAEHAVIADERYSRTPESYVRTIEALEGVIEELIAAIEGVDDAARAAG